MTRIRKMFLQSDATSLREQLLALFLSRYSREREKNDKCGYQYIETILVTLAEKKALDIVSDLSVDLWVQPDTFMDAFTCRPVNPLCFLRPVEKFVKLHMNKTVEEWHIRSSRKVYSH